MSGIDDPLLMLALPNQAGIIYNTDSNHPIRQKHLFMVRFLRKATTNDVDWRNEMTFLVKSIERPSIEASVEVINQYNKKRVVRTGFRYNPVNVTFYDTADNSALKLWNSYAKYFVGDFHHLENGFTDDIINSSMSDQTKDKAGWGLKIQPKDKTNGIGSQFFFQKIQIIQLWGNEYSTTELINPVITTFNPDDLDYSSNGDVGVINMTIQYEGLLYENDAKPLEVAGNSSISEAFKDGSFGPIYKEVLGQQKLNSFTSTPDPLPYDTNDLLKQDDVVTVERDIVIDNSGVLSAHGNFDFGDQNDDGTVIIGKNIIYT